MPEEKDQKRKKLAQRLTYEDVANSQNILIKWIRGLIRTNGIIQDKSRRDFMKLCAESMLTQGQFIHCYINHDGKNINLGTVEAFAFKLSVIDKPMVELTFEDVVFRKPISVYWDILLDRLNYVLPNALVESFLHSKEYPAKSETVPYDFSTKDR